LKSHLRNLELRISKALMSRVTKVIALTKFLAEDFAPGKPYLVVEGIIDEQDANRLSSSEKQRKDRDIVRVVYTGSIAKRYGIQNIVEAFTLLENKNIILEVYGCGDYEDELRQICLKNKNIKYYGFVPNEKALRAQREADFLINARSADDEYVKYSFPSKTLEYMLSGTPYHYHHPSRHARVITGTL
jgi:glycosyltransferase involved in cell wall biosynthesis